MQVYPSRCAPRGDCFCYDRRNKRQSGEARDVALDSRGRDESFQIQGLAGQVFASVATFEQISRQLNGAGEALWDTVVLSGLAFVAGEMEAEACSAMRAMLRACR